MKTALTLAACGAIVLILTKWNSNSESGMETDANVDRFGQSEQTPAEFVPAAPTTEQIIDQATNTHIPVPTQRSVTKTVTAVLETASPTPTAVVSELSLEARKFVNECKAIVDKEKKYATVPFLGRDINADNVEIVRPYFNLPNHPELSDKLNEGLALWRKGVNVDLSQCVDVPTLFTANGTFNVGMMFDRSADVSQIKGIIAIGKQIPGAGDYMIDQLLLKAKFSSNGGRNVVQSVVLTNNSATVERTKIDVKNEAGETIWITNPRINVRDIQRLQMYSATSDLILIPEGWTYVQALDYLVEHNVFGTLPSGPGTFGIEDFLFPFNEPVVITPEDFADFKGD